MKKKVKTILAVIAVATTVATTQTFAQDAPFVKGSKTIGFSLGAGVDYGYTTYYGGNYVNLPAIAVTYDQGFFEDVGPGNIGIGGIIGFKTSNYKYSNSNGSYKTTYTNFIVALRGTYHLTLLVDKNNKFDPYAGITIGVRFFDYSDNDPYDTYTYSYNSVYPVIGPFIGAKYNFAKNFGAFAELGYDISVARIGLNINF